MAAHLPPLLSLEIDPRARLLLFDIADDPTYAAMEIQVFDDDLHGQGVLVLLAHHDATVDIHYQSGLRLERRPFSVGRGIGAWREAVIDPAHLEVFEDGVVADVALDDAAGRRIEVHIDDRDGRPRSHSTLLAPVSSGVEEPQQLLVVLLREFDLVRTSGATPSLSIGGEHRTFAAFPGPSWVHRRRFIRYSGAPVIVSVSPALDGPVDPGSLGPLDRLETSGAGASAALRFEPPLPDLRALAEGAPSQGAWALDVARAAPLFGGEWTASGDGGGAHVSMTVTQPWRPQALPLSLRLVTTVARVFRTWPTTYAWTADVDLAASPPSARTGWTRTAGPDRANAYGVLGARSRRALVAAALAAVAAGSAFVVTTVRRRRQR